MTERLAPWLMWPASRPEDGGGHIARCRLLGGELARGAPVVFALDGGGEAWRAPLRAAGFGVTAAGRHGAGPWAGCVVDHYRLSAAELAALRSVAAPLVMIDDFLDPPDAVDLIVNGAPHLDGDRLNGVRALLGPRYALVDPRYAALRARPLAAVETLLVSFGRVDPPNATGLALDALAIARAGGFAPTVTVALGAASPHVEAVRAALAALGAGARLVLDGDMAELLAGADLVVGAGGVGLLERLAAGVPSVTVAIAGNQRLQAVGADRRGATLYVGNADAVSARELAAAVVDLAGDERHRADMAWTARALIDGRGAARVAAAIRAYARALARPLAEARS